MSRGYRAWHPHRPTAERADVIVAEREGEPGRGPPLQDPGDAAIGEVNSADAAEVEEDAGHRKVGERAYPTQVARAGVRPPLNVGASEPILTEVSGGGACRWQGTRFLAFRLRASIRRRFQERGRSGRPYRSRWSRSRIAIRIDRVERSLRSPRPVDRSGDLLVSVPGKQRGGRCWKRQRIGICTLCAPYASRRHEGPAC